MARVQHDLNSLGSIQVDGVARKSSPLSSYSSISAAKSSVVSCSREIYQRRRITDQACRLKGGPIRCQIEWELLGSGYRPLGGRRCVEEILLSTLPRVTLTNISHVVDGRACIPKCSLLIAHRRL